MKNEDLSSAIKEVIRQADPHDLTLAYIRQALRPAFKVGTDKIRNTLIRCRIDIQQIKQTAFQDELQTILDNHEFTQITQAVIRANLPKKLQKCHFRTIDNNLRLMGIDLWDQKCEEVDNAIIEIIEEGGGYMSHQKIADKLLKRGIERSSMTVGRRLKVLFADG